LISAAARCDSATPEGARGTSTHPVNRFSMFHWLSPWRISTRVWICIAAEPESTCHTVVRQQSSAHRARCPSHNDDALHHMPCARNSARVRPCRQSAQSKGLVQGMASPRGLARVVATRVSGCPQCPHTQLLRARVRYKISDRMRTRAHITAVHNHLSGRHCSVNSRIDWGDDPHKNEEALHYVSRIVNIFV